MFDDWLNTLLIKNYEDIDQCTPKLIVARVNSSGIRELIQWHSCLCFFSAVSNEISLNKIFDNFVKLLEAMEMQLFKNHLVFAFFFL